MAARASQTRDSADPKRARGSDPTPDPTREPAQALHGTTASGDHTDVAWVDAGRAPDVSDHSGSPDEAIEPTVAGSLAIDIADPVSGLAAEVDALRLRLDEQGAVLRRTHQTVVGLAESVGKVVAHQRRRERGLSLNSFVAYTLFTLLLGGAFFMLYTTRAGDLVEARDAALRSREETRVRLRALESEVEARERTSATALEYYQLLRDGRHAEVLARYPEIERQDLTPTESALFASGVEQAKSELVDAGYLAGLDAFRAGDLAKAATELRTALAYEDNGPRTAQMRYYLGVALFKQRDHEEAVRQLELAIAGRVEKIDVRYYLAAALDGLGELDKA
ncbi:MAG TPA: tetratricopeptide repeat protein, partial [Haliangium sp.]|nr:tetratricopeptide repeat protein [Haliangium sp.]